MPSPRGYTQFPSQADLFYYLTTSSTSEEDLNLHYAPPSKSSLKVGVLVLTQAQLGLLDLAVPVDMLAMVSRNQMSRCNAPETALDEAVDEIDIRYVSETGGSFPVTSGARIGVTNSFDDAPQFDILIVPGSFSIAEVPVSVASFITSQAPDLLAILSISSGIVLLAQTNLIREKRATAPPLLLPTLRQRLPATLWQEAPWVRHDKVWTSSSAFTAVDMMTAFMREYFWDRSEAVEYGLGTAGVPRLNDEL